MDVFFYPTTTTIWTIWTIWCTVVALEEERSAVVAAPEYRGYKKSVYPPPPHTRLLRCPSFLRASLKVHKSHTCTVRTAYTVRCTTADQIKCTIKKHFDKTNYYYFCARAKVVSKFTNNIYAWKTLIIFSPFLQPSSTHKIYVTKKLTMFLIFYYQ